MSDRGENLQSEIDDEEPMYMDHSRRVQDDDEEDESATVEVMPKKNKKKKTIRLVDSSKEDGEESDGNENVASRRKKSKKSRKNQQAATQTLLKFLDVGDRKKQVTFDVEKKKCKYQRKQMSADETEDSSAFEDLVCSFGNYKKVCPTRTSVQVFLMSK